MPLKDIYQRIYQLNYDLRGEKTNYSEFMASIKKMDDFISIDDPFGVKILKRVPQW